MDIQGIISELKHETEKLERAIAALEGGDSSSAVSNGRALSKPMASVNKKTRGPLTPEGRKRLSESMKKRWAERRKRA
jgi:Spy/CpxP family protein refolding chaperone